MQTIDTVATVALYRVMDTYIHARIGDGQTLPFVTLTFLQTSILVFLKTRIEIDHIRDDTVLFHGSHNKRIVQDSRCSHYYIART